MIHILIGTRAQLIKMIPIMHLLQEKGVDYNFIFMAQHHETIYEMLNDFGLKRPDYTLCDTGTDIVTTSQMIKWSLKALLIGIKERSKIFNGDKSGIVLIHGDAPPLLLGGIIAKAQGLKVGSVEAGLRSHNLFKPFPEELTRVISGKIGLIDIFYCQDSTAEKNAKKYKKGKIINTHGNTIIDAIELARTINSANTQNTQYGIVTIHRYETIRNLDRLKKAIEFVEMAAKKMPLIFILHPPTRRSLKDHGLYERLSRNKNISLRPRMSFLDFNKLLCNSQFIITDGGSNQEESAHLGIPCLLLRTETERQDGIGNNVLLSNFKKDTVLYFLNTYETLRREPTRTHLSPTRIIVNSILEFA